MSESKYVLCPECEGEGSFGPGFVYTQEDIDRDFESIQDFTDHVAAIRAGEFDVPCDFCKGKRVVVDIEGEGDERTTAHERWVEECEYRAMVAMERRYGC